MVSKRVCCLSVAIVSGVILLTVGIVFIPFSKTIVHNEINEQISLRNKDTLKNWKTNPIPIYFQIWVWNLTNPLEVLDGTGKPSFQQSGPYTYSEWRKKVNVTFNDNGTVTYREDRYFKFERSMSVGPEETVFTTVNIPMMTIGHIIMKEFSWIKEAVEGLFEWANEKLFIQLSVKDIMWGYEDPLLNKTIGLLHDLKLNVNLSTKFGLFINQNGTDDGLYNIYDGSEGSSQFAIIHSWNSMAKLPYWTTNISNMVNGTDGTMFPPFVKKSDKQYLFSSDLCRSIYVTYKEDTKVQDIDVYRFVAPAEVFMNSTLNPDNAGFCAPECFGSGVLNVENCRDGAPVVLSQPHFLSAAPQYIHGVDGMHPDPEKHETVIDLEPNTGVAFNAEKKLQINILIQPIDKLTQTQHLKRTIFPVLWLNEHATLDKKNADKFRSQLLTPVLEMHVGTYCAIGLGGLLLLIAVIAIVVGKVKTKRNGDGDKSGLLTDPQI